MDEGTHERGERNGELTTVHVRRALAGDVESLGWIVERLSPLLLAQARFRLARHLQGLYSPEDLVQDVWYTALPRLGRLEPRNARMTPVLLRFLSSVLLNHYRNLVQKHVRRRPLRLSLEGEDAAIPSDGVADLAASQTGVVTRAIRTELGERTLAAIDSLDELDRRIVVLRGIEQTPSREVAFLLGMQPGTVAVRYHRALHKLRLALPASAFEELEEDAQEHGSAEARQSYGLSSGGK